MIAFLEGQLVEKHPTHVIVDVQGRGISRQYFAGEL